MSIKYTNGPMLYNMHSFWRAKIKAFLDYKLSEETVKYIINTLLRISLFKIPDRVCGLYKTMHIKKNLMTPLNTCDWDVLS